MLDKQKVMQELVKSVPELFKESTNERARARTLFTWLQKNPDAVESLKNLESSIIIPSWQGAIDIAITIEPHEYPYAVIAVDGSQIYPDRHQGMSCYLLNAGIAHFTYGEQSSARLHSAPSLFTQADTLEMTEELVNCRRAELEFEVGLQESRTARSQNPTIPVIFLCDGSLIFWHLESKHPRIKERFLKRYIEQLDAFYRERILIAGFISLPKSKELVSILRKCVTVNLVAGLEQSSLGLLNLDSLSPDSLSLETVIDTDIADFFLKKGESTGLFVHNSTLAQSYPPHLRPCFVYLHCGDEIARIEIPFWIAQEQELLTRVVRIIFDQCIKGNGYPIALSESHEQAVVTSADRQFFFEMLYKMALDKNYRMPTSQKSLKKRYVSI